MEQMNNAPTEPMIKAVSLTELPAFGELLKRTLKMYETFFKKAVALTLISAAALLPLVLVIFSFGLLGGRGSAIKILVVVLFAAAFIFFIYITSAVQAAIILLLEDNSLGVVAYFKRGLGLAWKAVAVSLLTGLLTLLWTLLLIIPGIIFSVYYSFGIYALVYENQTGMAALKRSHQLIKNYWWAVVSRTVILSLIYIAALLIVSTPLYFLPENSALALFWNMVLSALRFITGPIFVIFAYLMFKELVLIKGSALTNAAQKTA